MIDAERAAALIADYGSPMYVYDLDRVRRALSDLRDTVPAGATVLYSLKANPHIDLVRTLLAGGCQAEVSSSGELATALAAGADPAEMFYTGPGKTAVEVRTAIAAGVGTFSVESLVDLERVAEAARSLGRVVDCALRVNGADAPGGAGMRMTGEASQFGADVEVLLSLRDALRAVSGVRLAGFHFFPLTNAYDEHSLVAEMRGSIATAATLAEALGIEVRVLDLGGGFGCPFAKEGERPRYPGLREPVTAALDERFPAWRSGGTRVFFESGRHLVGDSGTLLCTVSDVKDSRGSRFAVLDTGINHLGGLSGIGRLLPLSATALPFPAGGGDDSPAVKTRLVGPLCTPADTLGRGAADVPPVRVGQTLAIPNVGAYGATASLIGFLSRPGAAEVVVSGGSVVSASRLCLVREPIAKPVKSVEPGKSVEAVESVEAAMETAVWDERFAAVLTEALPRLSPVRADASLRAAGLDSLALVDLLVRLEEAYDVTISDDDLSQEAFATPASLWGVVSAALAR
ncbi:phosphopantetheine-binding protein [Actinokineospora iranica]|uniref:Diaminopimelate decarboxylase n=1 Tax=Actinokineospora iranica TaxID=1271860 RepID=A0A1G6JWB0_9PSEU|nr:phosphopantetheine-binding protein [Actinokineospora iranica]SDC23042.1 diaminopimelate decarboxylase [Actinokineospora iranica]